MLTFDNLRAKNIVRGDEWNLGVAMTQEQKEDDLLFRSNELAGEVGEACNVVKKFARMKAGMVGGVPHALTKDMLADELADVIICVDRVAEVFGINLSLAVMEKFNKTSRKNGLSVFFEEVL